ncbi:LPS export ABC transporter permease LptG [Porphyrobacter sp. AAP82]|uniref:LPS export ABC transporter permease LptG n=1 Tax=Porphyrobacter sp. AAP82 TaxID=1248917 RepID=UPI0002F123DB|nr:LPS export ABC transporter permease LptG [Porphyrobacter sp. AAP82]
MQLDFFPSRTLTLYLARLFVVRIIAVLFMLVLVLLALDLLSKTGDILAAPGNGQAEVLRYASLRLPQLVANFLPYSVLLASLLTFWPLNANSEVIAMRAAGLSAHQVLSPMLLTALLVAAVSFGFNERILTRANATLKAWEAADYGPIPGDDTAAAKPRANIYLTDGENILSAATLTGAGQDIVLTGVTWYARAPGGIIREQIRSPRATFAAPGWRLEKPVKFDVAGAITERPATLVVGQTLSPERIMLQSVDPDAQSFWELGESITAYETAGRNTDEMRAKWWHRLSGPLSALLMPLLGSIAAFGLARSGQLFVRAIIGMALGFAYFVVDNAALAMGSFGGYPPLLAAWAPFVLFLLVGETVLIRTEE